MNEANNSTTTRSDRDTHGRFLTGNSGGGRPKGSRNLLSTAFLGHLHAEWLKSGPLALQRMAAMDPSGFCRLVGQVLPRQMEASISADSEAVSLMADARDFAESFRKLAEFVGSDLRLTRPPRRLKANVIDHDED